jgi:hypothetical protein
MNSNTEWLQRGTSLAPDWKRSTGRDRGWTRARHGGRRRLRPTIFLLEDRQLLSSTVTVTSTDDSAPANNPTQGTLRWAVEQADTSTTGATINFNLSTPAMITLAQGPLDLSNLGGVLTLDGPGAGSLTVSGGGQGQVFTLNQVEQGGRRWRCRA